MSHLTQAHQELFRRTPDETFASVAALLDHCQRQKEAGKDQWQLPGTARPVPGGEHLSLALGDDGAFALNDWSFGQLCRLAGVSKDTLNRLSPETSARALTETLPRGNKPIQVLTQGQAVRGIHGTVYTRLWNADLLQVVREFATDFTPPQEAFNGSTGLYCGEQDMFCFLIDPTGWAEIQGEAFAPGFFLWNSEVGRRSIGLSTFWFQAVCCNHIVWDATEVMELSVKHTAKVFDALSEIRRSLDALTKRRDERRDGFVRVVKKAMEEKLGEDAEEAAKTLARNGIPKGLAQQALEIAREQGRFTIFSVVDALTRLARECKNAGDRVEADGRASKLLALAA